MAVRVRPSTPHGAEPRPTTLMGNERHPRTVCIDRAEGRGEPREPARRVRGTVQRVDHHDEWAVRALETALLGKNPHPGTAEHRQDCRIGIQVGGLIAFSIITETVFQWPGMGQLFIQSVQFADIPVMAAYLVMVSFIFVAINFFVDLLYAAIDPRLRLDRAQLGTAGG